MIPDLTIASNVGNKDAVASRNLQQPKHTIVKDACRQLP